jgi:hypothetical protein
MRERIARESSALPDRLCDGSSFPFIFIFPPPIRLIPFKIAELATVFSAIAKESDVESGFALT